MTQAYKYKAYISYSHADRRLAYWLHKTLETYRIPRTLVGLNTDIGVVPPKLTPIFRDRDELPVAGELGKALRKSLENSQFLIVIASTSSANSSWVNEEIRFYKHIHGESKVLVIIADGVPNSGDDSECFAPALRKKLNDEGEISDLDAEPLAADLRSHGDGKHLAKLKLVAGLTGLPLDKLAKRDEVRRHKRLLGYAGIATGVAISMTVLAVIAIQGQIEAEKQRAESDSLVEYMLTDLRMQLEPVGRLEIFDSVGKRALAYFAKQDVESLDADSLGRRARALHLVGEVRELQANTQGALVAFEQAMQTTGELLARDPTNKNRIYDHSQSTFWVGYIAWQRGEMDAAEQYFLVYHRLASQLVEIQPDNEDWLVEKSSSLINLGVMMHDDKRYDEAIDYFTQALKIDERLAAANPSDREKQWALAQSYAWLSDAMSGNHDFSSAMEQRQQELAIYADILAIDERDARALEGSSTANVKIANLSMLNGNYEFALEASKRGLNTIASLVADDPSNSLWRQIEVAANNQLVEAYMFTGNWEQAHKTNTTAVARAQALVEADPSVITRKTSGLMTARWMQIAIAFALQDKQPAQALLAQFYKDFAEDSRETKQEAHTSWVMVYAMDALNKYASNETNAANYFIQALTELNPTSELAIAVLHYLETVFAVPLLPADRAAQARNIGYDPALVLNKNKVE